jgi:hypothetical protein
MYLKKSYWFVWDVRSEPANAENKKFVEIEARFD